MNFIPTPRDLFNPPPQALFLSNMEALSDLRNSVWDIYWNRGDDETRDVMMDIVRLLEDHEERLGS